MKPDIYTRQDVRHISDPRKVEAAFMSAKTRKKLVPIQRMSAKADYIKNQDILKTCFELGQQVTI